tara:strand:+ start:52 stop:2883 length:2832 start_codon:yes stop_codon:yes gene_type:complete
MLLKNLFSNLKSELAKIKINNISFDSRNVKNRDLFISIKGNKLDGNHFIDQAILNGAKVIVYSGKIKKKNKITYLRFEDTRKVLAKISTKFFNKKPKNIVAVTGTNGKTSISDFFYQIFNLQRKKAGFIGTLGFRKGNLIKKRNLTTLDSLTLNKDLYDMKKAGINNAIIEASSHGLKQKRLDFLKLKAGIFTNFSHDHLDYHKSMRDYLNSKLLLFRNILDKKKFVITDTDIKEYNLIKKIQKKNKLKILSIGSKSNIINILNHKIFNNFQILEVKYNKKIYKLKINLYGSIQIKNLLMAILAAKVCGLKIEKIFNEIEGIKSVEGRLQLIRILPNKSKIFIDYAHTPDALRNAILSLREHYNKKITVIFGCGGERDKDKRKIMGKIAKRFCDKIYVTDDNPRNENPLKIRKEIMKGLRNSKAVEIANRKKAIFKAFNNSEPYEIILVAGKGHEKFQHIGKKKILISDKQIINNYKKKTKYNKKFYYLKFNNHILKKTLNNKKNYFFNDLSINSHTTKKNNLFLAIKGKKNDGHNYFKQALKNGANLCVISKKFKKNSKLLYVKDTMKFLNKFAKNKRNLSSAVFIAVTGSTGKTTVKTLLGSILKQYSNTYFSPKSYNNQYGVPLSISNIKPDDDFGVFEVGMSKFNEINNLSAIVKPHIGIITNVSEAHIENFKNLKEIAKAKSEIIQNIDKNGTIILNRDDKFFNYFKKVAEKKNIRIKSFGFSKKSDVRLISIKKEEKYFLLKILVNKKILILIANSSNKNYLANLLLSVTVINELNLNLNKLKNFFKSQDILQGRGKISKIRKFNKNFFLIDESYNANPLSVKSAIDNFSNIQKNGKKKYFLFGDMLELGKNSHVYHKKISKIINKSNIDKTFVYGNKAHETYKFLNQGKKGEVLIDLKSFKNKISKIIKNGDFLMIKGSNAMKLHEVSKDFLRSSK